MSLFPILPLQVRATTPDASAPDSGGSSPDASVRSDAPASSDAGAVPADATVPAVPDAGRTSSPDAGTAVAPDASADAGGIRGDTQSFYIAASGGYGWRGFGNSSQDTHEGPWISVRIGYPTLRMGSQWSLRPEFLYRHEWMGRNLSAEVGPGWRSSADLDTLGLGAVLGFDPHPLFGIEAGFHVGATHLGANAPEDGRGGIRYSDNRFGYSANNWGFDVEGFLRLGVPEQRIADGFYLGGGAEAEFGYNSFSLTPDSLARPTSDPAIGLNSIYGGIGLYLTGRFGSGSVAPRPAPEPSAPARPAEPVAPSAPPPAQETPPPPPPAPSALRVSRVPFTVAPNDEGLMLAVRDEEGFQSFFNQRIRNASRVTSAIEPVRNQAFALTLSVRYGTQSRGTLAVESLRIGETTYRNGHFPPDMPISSSRIQEIMNSIAPALPGYTGNRSRPLTIEITNAPAAS